MIHETQQEVKQFNDDNDFVIQSATLDRREPETWIVVMHNGNELSMSLENWNKLVKMTNELVSPNF